MRPSLRVVSDELTAQILDEAKRILAEIGVEILGENLRQKMLDSGLTQDRESGRIRFPPDVVDKAIASAPRSFRLYNRNGDFHTELGGDKVHFVPGSSALNLLDHRTGEHREAITSDFVEYVRVADGLPHIAYLATAFSTRDIEPQVSDAWRLYLCLTHSLKPVVSGAFTEHGVPRMAEMMQFFRRDKADLRARPLSVFTVTPTGLFRFSEDSSQNLIDCVEWGIPIEMVPVTLMGLIAPVTLVGATIFHVADVLSGLTLAQILKPGHPVLFGGAPATFHMKAASSPMAAIEAVHLDTAYVAVAKHLGLPTQSYMALSEGKFLDAQAGAETMTSAMLAALAGVNSVSGPGMLDYVLTFSLPKLVFDNEVCGQCLHFVREVRVLEDLPAAGLVDHLRQHDHLITAPHTLKYWPQELYLTDPVIDRENRENWTKAGSKELYQRACEQVDRRLAAYTPVETDPAIDAELRRLIRAALRAQSELPALPPLPAHAPVEAALGRRGRPGRRRG